MKIVTFTVKQNTQILLKYTLANTLSLLDPTILPKLLIVVNYVIYDR